MNDPRVGQPPLDPAHPGERSAIIAFIQAEERRWRESSLSRNSDNFSARANAAGQLWRDIERGEHLLRGALPPDRPTPEPPSFTWAEVMKREGAAYKQGFMRGQERAGGQPVSATPECAGSLDGKHQPTNEDRDGRPSPYPLCVMCGKALGVSATPPEPDAAKYPEVTVASRNYSQWEHLDGLLGWIEHRLPHAVMRDEGGRIRLRELESTAREARTLLRVLRAGASPQPEDSRTPHREDA